MTKTALQQELRNADITFRSKATKAELKKILADSQQTKKKTKANGHAKGAKATLREKFKKIGVVTPRQIDQIAATLNVQPATIFTAISDLKNPKYAGSAGSLAIQKEPDGTYRLVK